MSNDNYIVTVDYGASLETMITAGEYDRVDPEILDFQLNGQVTVAEVTLELFSSRNSEAASEYMRENGIRPPDIWQFLAFGATYPEIQREYPIIGLCQTSMPLPSMQWALCLNHQGPQRELEVFSVVYGMRSKARYLAVRKIEAGGQKLLGPKKKIGPHPHPPVFQQFVPPASPLMS